MSMTRRELQLQEHTAGLEMNAAYQSNDIQKAVELVPLCDPRKVYGILLTAAADGNMTFVKEFVRHADPAQEGSFVLRSAAQENQVECLAFLLPRTDISADGYAVVRWALEPESGEALDLLLQHCPADFCADGHFANALYDKRKEAAVKLLPFVSQQAIDAAKDTIAANPQRWATLSAHITKRALQEHIQPVLQHTRVSKKM